MGPREAAALMGALGWFVCGVCACIAVQVVAGIAAGWMDERRERGRP